MFVEAVLWITRTGSPGLDLRRRHAVRAVALAAVVLLCWPLGARAAFPGATWQTKAPEELNMDRRKLDQLKAALPDGTIGMIVRDGYVVDSWGDLAAKHGWASAAKPLISTLLFFAVEEGRIPSVDARVEPYVRAAIGRGLRAEDRGITFRHLANMVSGYALPEGPGQAFGYNDHAISLYMKALFGGAFEQGYDQAAMDPSRFGALGIEDGSIWGPRWLNLSTRDMARIALFWLNRGNWDGRQLLPRSYFDRYMRPDVPADLRVTRGGPADDYLGVGTFGGGANQTVSGPGIYGFNWWFNPGRRTWPGAPEDVVTADGLWGRYAVHVIPSLALVAVWSRPERGGGGTHAADTDRLLRMLVESVEGPVPADGERGTAGSTHSGAGTISGELRKWHKVTVTFDGPQTGETARPNPFLDYRLDVTFTAPSGRHFIVPGYYAADGDAARSSAETGTKWRVHFAPPEAGRWTYRASFRRGPAVAVSTEPEAGQTAGHFDGATGTFAVAPTNKGGRDLRGKGRLEYVGRRYLRFAETGEYFVKGGADSPENLLAYEGFDNTPDDGGRRKTYGAHVRDWRDGDPTWKGGAGKGIIGAVNYLSGKGANALSFLTMNIAGDDRNVFPYLRYNDSEGVQDDRLRFDVSKLDQWEIVFEHAGRKGMYLHFKTQETENDHLLDGGHLGVERKLYYRELIARFGHHLALNWNLGEENTNSDAQRKEFAAYIHDIDPYDHPLVVHTFPGRQEAVYRPLLGDASRLTGASVQTLWNNVHGETLRWVTESARTGKPWVVANDEQGDHHTGVRPQAGYNGERGDNHGDIRKQVLWGNLMAGGAGVEYYFGYQYQHSDLTLEDFRSRDRIWDYTRHALSFFGDHLPYWEMESDDGLASGAAAWVLAKPGGVYAVYLPEGGEVWLDLGSAARSYSVRWYDPRTGGDLQTGSVGEVSGPGRQSLGPAPGGDDWVALVR